MYCVIVSDTINIDCPKFKIEEMQKGPRPFRLFNTRDEAAQYIRESLNIAKERLYKTKEMHTALLKENQCTLDFTIEGDTYGIHESCVNLVTTVNGLYFSLTLLD